MTDPTTPLAERMIAAARELQDQDDPGATMASAVRLAKENIGGCDAAGLSLVRRRRRIETPAYTDELVRVADSLQVELDEGPCLDAIWEEGVVHSPDLANDDRWPRWAPRVGEELGVRGMLCYRLFTHEDTLGGLNLYSRSAGGFTGTDREDGLALAAHIAVAVAAAQRISQLAEGLDSRTVIGQALGILMERYDIDADHAFQLLDRVSSHSHRKLRSVADEIVATRRVPGLDAEAPAPGGDQS